MNCIIFVSMIKFILVALTLIVSVSCLNKKKEDKLLLSPVELIDLVRKEQQRNRVSPITMKNVNFVTDAPCVLKDNKGKPELNTEGICEDKTTNNRKVWSRWSKWGLCSVTCGGGTIERHRVCVGGRCAHGEREEQRRPCSRAPCLAPPFDNTVDEPQYN